MRSFIKQFLHNQSGVAAIEFAILTPFLFFLCLGIVEFAGRINTSMDLENAARAGAQFARSAPDDEANITQAASEATTIPAESLDVDIDDVCGCYDGSDLVEELCTETCEDGSAAAHFVSVTASADVQSITTFFDWLPLERTISRNATIRIAQ